MAVVVAQLVERSLPTPEVRSSNPVIYIRQYLMSTVVKKEKKKNRPGMTHFLLQWTDREGFTFFSPDFCDVIVQDEISLTKPVF